eukprot:326215_1
MMTQLGICMLIIGYIFISFCKGQLISACILPVRKICADPMGNSTLGSFNLTLNLSEGYGGDNWISSSIPAKSIKFRLTPTNYYTTWHNCPVSQFIMNMNAGNLVTFSNGDTTVFEAGEIFYCDDANASGHKSQNYKNQSRYSVFVAVDNTFDSGPCPNPNKPQNINDDIPLCNDTVAAGMMALNQFAKK